MCEYGGLQDHVVAGTLLTARDTFLARAEAMQLLYACCSPTRPWAGRRGRSGAAGTRAAQAARAVDWQAGARH